MVAALAVDQAVKDLRDFPIFDHRTQAHRSHVVERDFYPEAAGFDPEKVKLLYVEADRPAADLLDNPYAMIGIYDFIADLETEMAIHETPEWRIVCGETAKTRAIIGFLCTLCNSARFGVYKRLERFVNRSAEQTFFASNDSPAAHGFRLALRDERSR